VCCVRHELPLLTIDVKNFDDFATQDGLLLVRAPES
jgi:hypothetical protein